MQSGSLFAVQHPPSPPKTDVNPDECRPPLAAGSLQIEMVGASVVLQDVKVWFVLSVKGWLCCCKWLLKSTVAFWDP